MAKSISQLNSITAEAIDLSQFLAIDDPTQTFKLSLLQLRDFFTGQLFPVGSTLFRLDNRTPNECGFPGTWTKAVPDVSLHTANTDGSNLGQNIGSNAPTVPLPAHAHTATSASAGDHTHTASSASAGDHGHTASAANAGSHTHNVNARISTRFLDDGGWNFGNTLGGAAEHHQDTNTGPIALAAGDHTHGISVANGGAHSHGVTVTNAGAHTHGVTVDNSGTAGATLDVRGARILGHLWHRTA